MWPDPARLRATVEHLQAIERPSASDGERRAAAWIRDELAALGCDARV
jgi:acetylornithine deacetylase/succinyl-diaminopimelate desuccinylase-like protein